MKYKLIMTLLIITNSAIAQVSYPIIELPLDKNVILLFDDIIYTEVTNMSFEKEDVASVFNGNRVILSCNNDEIGEGSLYIELNSGHYYQLIVRFEPRARKLNYSFTFDEAIGINKISASKKKSVIVASGQKPYSSDKSPNIEELRGNSLIALDKSSNLAYGEEKNKLQFLVNGIFYKEEKLYFRLTFYNRSNLDYEIKLIDFNKVSKGGFRKKSGDPIPVKWVYALNQNNNIVKGKSSLQKVFVFDKFTISSKKYFSIELLEDNGERSFKINIPSKELLSATKL